MKTGFPRGLLLLALAVASVAPCTREGETKGPHPGPKPRGEKNRFVRPSALAGSWYSADAARLEQDVRHYLAEARRNLGEVGTALPEETLAALVSPHAGYAYSGPAAGFGYSLLKPGEFRRVIVLGPSHHGRFEGISTPDETHYETPLGLVPIDREAVEALRADPLFVRQPAAEAREHSIEIQLPFLQVALGEFRLVPLLVGRIASHDYARAAERIRAIADGSTLLVASSDFTHYGPNYGYVPFPRGLDLPARIEELDMGAVRRIRDLDPAGFDSYRRATGATICGALPIAVLMAALPRDAGSALLRYDTSGRQLDDWTNSVSYVSLGFFVTAREGAREPRPAPAEVPMGPGPSRGGGLTDEELSTALALARASLVNHLAAKPVSRAEVLAGFRLTEALKARAGAFVTLKKNGDLRGCIGTIEPVLPLGEAIYENAVRAAVEDPRFRPVTAEEVAAIVLEVSVLSTLEPIAGPDRFEVGRHGIVLKKGFAQALFLPQVATEQGWGRDETLARLSLKAGLPPEAWREGTRFWVFTAQVVGEERPGGGAAARGGKPAGA